MSSLNDVKRKKNSVKPPAACGGFHGDWNLLYLIWGEKLRKLSLKNASESSYFFNNFIGV